MIQALGIIFELIGTIAGFLMTYFVLRQNSKYIGNKLMAASTMLISIYIGSILIYDIVATEAAIQIFYRIGIVSIMLSALLMFATMQVMVHSSSWFRNNYKFWFLIGCVVAFAIYIISIDFITIIDLEVVNTQIDIIPLAILSLWIISFLVLSSTDLYLHGIKNVQGETKKNMKIFLAGLLINLIAVGFTVFANLTDDSNLQAILVVIFFLTLAIGTGVMTVGFMKKKPETKK